MQCQCETLTELRGGMAISYIENHLKKVRVDAINWTTEYVCPITGKRWIKDYPHSELQGGGEPRLRMMS